MVELRQVKKISVLVICGMFLGAGLLPIMNGAQTIDNKTHGITMDIATRVATAKLQELNKRDFSITETTKITNEKGEPLFYVFNLNPPGYLIITGSYDLPPVIAYSFYQ